MWKESKMKSSFKRTKMLILLPFLFIVACGGGDNSSQLLQLESEISGIEAEPGALTEIDCPLPIAGETEGETYACGIYTVPIDYDNPGGETLNLVYTILYASDENPEPDPIVYLAGGPGQSGVVSAGGAIYGDLRQRRDLIFPAQRGTLFASRLALEECVALLGEQIGGSELNDFVDQVTSAGDVDRALPYDQYLAQYSQSAGLINARCHEAFSTAGLDPAQFTTANSTNDIISLLGALGYDNFNLHGTSYGTRLALEIMRRHPEAGIRSVVLDSPSTPTSDRFGHLATATHDMVLRLFENCAASPDCAAAYPDLTQRTADLLQQLTDQPLSVGDQTIDQDALLTQLRDLSNTRANYVPRMIAELGNGDPTTYLALYNGEVGTEPPEGSVTSNTVSALIQDISMAGVTADNPFAGLQVVADVLKASSEQNPREAMKANAQEALAGSDSLPQILDQIDNLTEEDLNDLQSMLSEPGQEPVDEEVVQLRTEATSKNTAQFLLSGIVCSEQLPFSDIDAALASQEELPIPGLATSGALLATEVGNCQGYPMGESDPTYHEPVDSDVPTLIFQGEFDVRTPLANGLALADQLANATLVIVPQSGHETWGGGGCIAQIGQGFISDPGGQLDLSCLEGRQERFSLPGEPLGENE
jgi:pimeloyl-ACP methyl ester carboxylesterase